MTKPNDFIFNSDYLSLAETDRKNFTIVIPAMPYTQVSGFDSTTQYSTTIQCKATASAIDEFQITYNGKTWFGDSLYYPPHFTGVYEWEPYWILIIHRKDADSIELNAIFVPSYESSGATTPLLTLGITVCSFRPPNVF